jgi:cystine transport system substrate-binding protein
VLRPAWRLLGIAAAGTAALPLAASALAQRPAAAKLHADQRALAAKQRSAVLDLYSLDARVGAADARLETLRRQEGTLRAQRAQLAGALRLAGLDTKVAERRLAARVRALYDRGATTTLDLILGAQTLTAALNELDNVDSVTEADRAVLLQVRNARRREVRLRGRLALRERRLRAAVAGAAAEARSLEAVRAQRSAYVAGLQRRQALDAQRLAAIETSARAAQTKAARLTHTVPAAAVATPVPRREQTAGGTVTVVATGYCLKGSTATGVPTGWGVAAVDPGVIPLGTHLTIPGYGAAVAADTGGAIAGARIDLWFPTCAQAGGWGTRSVTIALH